jgi:hypothetical protein
MSIERGGMTVGAESKAKRTEIEKMTVIEFTRDINGKTFWETLLKDLNSHATSQTPTYSFSNFLQHYKEGPEDINRSIPGKYAKYCLALLDDKKGRVRELIVEPSKDLAMYLMWGHEPSLETKDTVLEVRKICAEFFQDDCLYVEFQNPDFWKVLKEDLEKDMEPKSFGTFLSYFSHRNLDCDRKMHTPQTAPYEKYLNSAEDKPGEIKSICEYLNLTANDKYLDNLQTLFLHFVPKNMEDLLKAKFPRSFDEDVKKKQAKEIELYNKAKDYLNDLVKNPDKELPPIVFDSKEELMRFRRKKLFSASTSMKLHLTTTIIDETTLAVKLDNRNKPSKKDYRERDDEIIRLRHLDLKNKQIAELLGVEDYIIETAVSRLIKAGKITSLINHRK